MPLFPEPENPAAGAGALLDRGNSPTSQGLPPPAYTGASLPGQAPQGQPPQGMPPMMGGGAVAPNGPMPQPPQQNPMQMMADQDSPQLGGGGMLGPAHGQALRELVKKFAKSMGR